MRIHTLTFPLLALLLHSAPLHAQTVVTLAASERVPYIGKSLPEDGYVAELATEALKRRGYRVKIVFYPVARARHLGALGKVDGLLPVYQEYGDGSFLYSQPFPGDTIGLLKKKTLRIPHRRGDRSKPGSLLASLSAYRFGVVRANVTLPAFDSGQIPIKELARDDVHNLDKLGHDKIDFALIDKYTAANLIVSKRSDLIGRFDFMSPALEQNAFHIAFSTAKSQHRQLLAAFNAGLAELKRDGTLNEILKKHGLFTPPKPAPDKVRLVIATVDNGDMLVMQELAKEYEKQHPDIALEWRVLQEEVLRLRLFSDLAVSDGQFDILTIGTYETPIWARQGWLKPLHPPDSYDVDDLLPTVRKSLSYGKHLYALPFYAESSMTYYRKDLFAKAGLSMPAAPSYDDIKRFAAAIHDPGAGVYGICLRGKAGWGDNMALIGTMVNVFGGRWFDERGRPQLDAPAWKQALDMYRSLLTQFGPPQAERNGYNENLKLFAEGHCGMWIDATVAAGLLTDPKRSTVASELGYVAAPRAVTSEGGAWLWSWALAVPSSSRHQAEAVQFITWATSKNYVAAVAKSQGLAAIPPGTRKSTYQNEQYLKLAPFAQFVLDTIEGAALHSAALKPNPFAGIQYVGIPEFQALGDQVGAHITSMLSGEQSVQEALRASQALTLEKMKNAGYFK